MAGQSAPSCLASQGGAHPYWTIRGNPTLAEGHSSCPAWTRVRNSDHVAGLRTGPAPRGSCAAEGLGPGGLWGSPGSTAGGRSASRCPAGARGRGPRASSQAHATPRAARLRCAQTCASRRRDVRRVLLEKCSPGLQTWVLLHLEGTMLGHTSAKPGAGHEPRGISEPHGWQSRA